MSTYSAFASIFLALFLWTPQFVQKTLNYQAFKVAPVLETKETNARSIRRLEDNSCHQTALFPVNQMRIEEVIQVFPERKNLVQTKPWIHG